MILSKLVKNRYFNIFVGLLLGLVVTVYVLENFAIWGPVKGPLGAFLWIVFLLSFLLIMVLDAYRVMLVYVAVFPFLLRLNITNFSFEFLGMHFHPFYVSEIMLVIMLSIKLLTEKFEGRKIEKASLYEFIIFFGVLLYMAGSLMSAMLTETTVGGNATEAFVSSFGQAIIPGLLFVLIFHSIRTKNQIIQILKIWYIAFFINILIGGYAFLTNIEAIQLFLKRMPFNFNGPNVYAAVVQIFIPLGVFMIYEQKTRMKKLLYYMLFFIILASLIMTLSRGGAIAAVFSLLFMAIIRSHLRKPMKRIGIAIFIMGMMISTAVYNLIMRFASLFATSRITEFSSLIRTSAWKASLEGIARYPMGIGGNQFPLLWADIGRFPSQLVLHSHNFILGIAVEYGLMTLIGFLLLISTIIYQLFRKIWKKENHINKRLSIVFITSIISYIIMGVVSEGPRCHLRQNGEMFNDGLIFFFIILAIAMRFLSLMKNEEDINNSTT